MKIKFYQINKNIDKKCKINKIRVTLILRNKKDNKIKNMILMSVLNYSKIFKIKIIIEAINRI